MDACGENTEAETQTAAAQQPSGFLLRVGVRPSNPADFWNTCVFLLLKIKGGSFFRKGAKLRDGTRCAASLGGEQRAAAEYQIAFLCPFSSPDSHLFFSLLPDPAQAVTAGHMLLSTWGDDLVAPAITAWG